jgi:hypothetical protein
VNAALPRPDASWPLKWLQYAITFDARDSLKTTTSAGTLPMLCTPTISNVLVTKTLIDGGTGLNVILVEAFDSL